jgi:hypothetical protein
MNQDYTVQKGVSCELAVKVVVFVEKQLSCSYRYKHSRMIYYFNEYKCKIVNEQSDRRIVNFLNVNVHKCISCEFCELKSNYNNLDQWYSTGVCEDILGGT